jgi:phosphatidylglycerol---prolipoprotein diacylglyceryl transferase
MHPTLIQLGELGLHTYGVSIAVGFVVAILLGVRSAQRQGISVERILDLSFWILVSSLLGSRALYLITEAGTYYRICVGADLEESRGLGRILLDCTRPLHLWEGGLVFYGGLICAVVVSIWYTRHHQMNFLRVADLCSPLIALGHFFGRLGCFAAGCCYGKVTARASLGLSFPLPSVAYQEMLRDGLFDPALNLTPPLYPTQLYESLAELVIFLFLLWVSQRKRFHGQVLATYLLAYPAVRFLLEIFRADPDRRYVVALQTPWLNEVLGLPLHSPSLLSTSQLISLLLVIAAAALLIWQRRQPNRNKAK